MRGDCDVSMLSKFEEEDLLVLSDEYDKQTEAYVEENDINDPQHVIQTLDEDEELNDNSAITTQNDLSEEESLEVNNVEGDDNSGITTQNKSEDIDWNDQYPPLLSRNIKFFSVVEYRSTSSWVDALKKTCVKKPCCPKKKLDISTKVNGEKYCDSQIKVNAQKSDVNGEKYCDSQVKVNGEKSKSIASSVFSSDEHELASSFFSINIPNLHDKFLKEQISLAELRIEENGHEQESELLKLKYEEIDSHLSMIVDRQEAIEQEMFAEEYLKTPNKTLKASGLKVESVAVVTPKQSNGDLKEDVSIEKVEEMERKEQKVEIGEEEKREKRQKRLRLRDRKRAARDGFSVNTANQEVNKEASSSLELKQENEDQDEMRKIETAENQSEPSSSLSMLQHIHMLKLVEDQDEIETPEYQSEPPPPSSSLNMQQQIAMLKLAELKEASKREKRRNKKKEKKKAKAKAKANANANANANAATSRDKKMKWIFITLITFITLMICRINILY